MSEERSEPGAAPQDALVVLVTAPDQQVADRLAAGLIDGRMAACVNLLPGVTSVYRWEGQVARDQEVLMIVKTTRARLRELEAFLVSEHPYDVPECVALAPAQVAGTYLGWLRASTAP